MDLKTMLFHVRSTVGDLGVKRVDEPTLVRALNEGKNELVKMIRQANEGFFQTSVSGTFSNTATLNTGIFSLPSDFQEMRNIECTTGGYENSEFRYRKQNDPAFRDAVFGSTLDSGYPSVFFYDFYGDSIIVAPKVDVVLAYVMHYIKRIPDMTYQTDWPSEFSPDLADFIITWGVCEFLRITADPRLDSYLVKLGVQKDSIVESVNVRQVKDPVFVRGYLEYEEGG